MIDATPSGDSGGNAEVAMGAQRKYTRKGSTPHLRLFDERHPELAWMNRMGTQERRAIRYREVVVDYHLSPHAIEKEFYHVLAARVERRHTILSWPHTVCLQWGTIREIGRS